MSNPSASSSEDAFLAEAMRTFDLLYAGSRVG